METCSSEAFSTLYELFVNYSYLQVFLVILFWLWRIVRGNSGPPRVLWLTKVNRAISSMVH
jgi:multisubunit Na+/H+ antiporter MnhF subunit